ncbi:site-specific integrase [Deinococcus sp. NW-56]|uniref:tyrosine-type recombinase/integrase n=1 Tax=Deinococcus sp. NW-56 TaxID=2080419 RepID=UPI00131A48C4|nr:site-specific integrase [Deinococcus sp. NW-56]
MAIRRRVGEGTVHPVEWKGRVVGYRDLATYYDPGAGKRRRKSVSRRTRAATERALRKLIRTLPQGQGQARPKTARPPALPLGAPPGSLHALLLRWLDYKARDVRPSTWRGYMQALERVLPSLGTRPLGQLTVLDVEDLVGHLQTESGPRLAGRVLHVLRMALQQAVRWQLVPGNVAQHVRKPRVTRPELTVRTPEQAARFLGAARGHRLHPLFAFALHTGMRRGELLALQWGDVDLDAQELTVRHNLVKNSAGQDVVGEPKTEAGRRRVALAEDIVALLRAHHRREHRGRRAPRPADFVFTAASGNHVQHRHLQRTFQALMDGAGVPHIRFHDLRHTAASLLIRQGVPAKVVANRLGHVDPTFTLKVYTYVYDDQRAQAALSLETLLAPVWGAGRRRASVPPGSGTRDAPASSGSTPRWVRSWRRPRSGRAK